ncbi:PQQ-binding-like beta-propeller repeat protein [Streptomyces sp. NBC_00825]|uniref:outer membrane protein assembly factor BamB family protein n=1 Tax=unclassified Streptomyces TaxID=2593676 RepID=UPI002ED5F954|nr:PQQ-binding-like beta-propeller repeat protein [Streptomyces sp. NBC_00826]WTH90351.1 PQQ-binding-like beta-propeller repeat protein [Streptomyces sp. NBC_00825]WTH99078.1 PQQ-binding-like beta-propeller repeat protein [Streptomyces sp. NBC_00822]
MEALRQDDPRRFGPYTVLARLRETASAVQYLAHVAASQDAVVITAARPELAALPAFRRRFQAEADTADRLTGDWPRPQPAGADDTPDDAANTAADESPDEDLLWTAGPYVPALTLAEAIGTTGPLPERAVRILGAGIAETLSRVHATGAVLQGLAPRTVLLAGDGPRLTAFGPLGAAAAAEARPGGQLSVRLGYLTPEQVAGEEPGPASDLFVLGLLLAYAATGTTPLADGPAAEGAERIARTAPELGAVPEELRDLVARCLAKAPADRPSAGTVAAELALEGAAGMAKGGWLPEALAAAVAEQGARAREAVASGRPIEGPAGGSVSATSEDPAAGPAEIPADAPVDAAVDGPVDTPPSEPVDTPPGAQAAEPLPLPLPDTQTAQFGNLGRQAPRTDRPTTQLSVPPELTGHPAAPAAAAPTPAALPAGPGGPGGPTAAMPGGVPAVPPPMVPPVPLPVPAGRAVSSARSSSPDANRRTLLIGLAAGAAGLVVGGGGALALGGDDGGSTDDPKPAPGHSGPTIAGLPPQPRWVYTLPAAEEAPLTAAVWNDRLLVLTGKNGATAVDLRTGRRAWDNPDAAEGSTALPAGKNLCFVATPSGFLWLSPKDGKTTHRVEHADLSAGTPKLSAPEIVGSSGPVVWFTGSEKVTVKAPPPKKGKKRGKDKQVVRAYLFAYDIVRREQLWRTPVPAGRGPGTPVHRLIAVRQDDLVVRQSPATLAPGDVRAAKGKAVFRSFDRKTGKALWTKQFGTVAPDAAALGDDRGLLYAAVGDDLQAFETPAGKPKWTLNGTGGTPYGTPVATGAVLHTTNRNQEVGAVERETGRLRWRRSTEAAIGPAAPAVTLSTTGRTLLAADGSQVTAFAAEDGRRLWKFQDIGAQDPKGPTVTAPYRVLTTGRTAVVQRGRIFYAFPVA